MSGLAILVNTPHLALGGFSKTPTEQAIRKCIHKAADYIVPKTPAAYYRQK